MNRKLYNAVQWTWGLPQTLIGAGLYLVHRHDEHFEYGGAKATVWDRDAGISLGKFIFVPGRRQGALAEVPAGRRTSSGSDADTGQDVRPRAKVDPFLLDHEYGHTIQSLALGPLYLVLVGAPSIIWNRLPYFARKRKEKGRSYYSAIFERTASELGEKHRMHR